MKTTTKRRQPAAAFRLSLGRCDFAAADTAAGPPTRGPIKLTASSGQTFNARFWGPFAIDYSGVTVPKERLALDYCHQDDEIVGYADQIATSPAGITVSGELISAAPGDRAQELLIKGQAGVPYEASIAWDPRNGCVIEEYQPGMMALVNGQQIPGPVTVLRKCLLRGVAVCPHGQDPFTDSQFSAGDQREIEVTVTSEEHNMSQTQPETTEQTVDALAQARAEFSTQLSDYTTRFGAELAAQWAGQKPLIDAYAEFVAKLKADHAAAAAALSAERDAAAAKATDLEARLAQVKIGETTPASSTPAELSPTKAAAAKFAGLLSPGLSLYAASLNTK